MRRGAFPSGREHHPGRAPFKYVVRNTRATETCIFFPTSVIDPDKTGDDLDDSDAGAIWDRLMKAADPGWLADLDAAEAFSQKCRGHWAGGRLSILIGPSRAPGIMKMKYAAPIVPIIGSRAPLADLRARAEELVFGSNQNTRGGNVWIDLPPVVVRM